MKSWMLTKERDRSKKLAILERENTNYKEQVGRMTAANEEMSSIVSEYEKALSQVCADREKVSSQTKESLEEVSRDRDQTVEDLRSVEAAFSDLHRRYEKSKNMIDCFKKNEDVLKKTVQDHQEQLRLADQKFDVLRQEAEEKLEKANQEIERTRRTTSTELTRIEAALKKRDLQVKGLEKSLEQKVSIQDELTSALCLKEDEVDTLKKIIEEREVELTQLQERHGEEVTSLNDQIQERESSIDQLTVQVTSLQSEVDNLTEFQSKLQDDFDTVQAMLEEKQKEVEHLSQDAADLSQDAAELRPQGDGASEQLRENLLRDLERERMLRVDAENRLRDATLESDDRSRIQSLHDEFKQKWADIASSKKERGKENLDATRPRKRIRAMTGGAPLSSLTIHQNVPYSQKSLTYPSQLFH